MKKILYVFILVQFALRPCGAQQFTFHGNSPFGIQTTSGMLSTQRLMFFDYDGDGDLDLFMSGMGPIGDFDNLTWENMPYFLDYQENTGDKSHPQFGPRQTAFNGSFPFPTGFFFPSAGDLNGDGRMDFIINALVDYIGNRTPVYYKNLNHTGTEDFEQIRFLDMDLPDFVPESFFIPELTDLDHDGDLDILMSGINPAFMEEDGPDVPIYYYAKNIGTPQAPEFLGWYDNPYGLVPNPMVEVTNSGDIDNDGDTDILGVLTAIPDDSLNYIYFHNNSPGPNGKPSFGTVTESPFGLPSSFGNSQFFSPTLVDIDADGDLDFFVLQGTTSSNELKYFENSLCISIVSQAGVDLCQGDSLVIEGQTYTAPGDYVITIAGPNGCDTILFLSITTIPVYTTSLTESICEGETYTIGNESFNATGTYTVSLTAANGCDSVVSLDLNVNEVYNFPVFEILCEGDVYHIGDQTFTSSGHYEVVLSSVQGCDSIISLDLFYTVLLNDLTQIGNTLFADQTGAGFHYQWLNCDTGEHIVGETNVSFTPSTSGNYGVVITSDQGCTIESECISVIIDGIAEAEFANKISIYPNPTAGIIRIENKTQFPITTMTLINFSGRVMDEVLLDGNHPVDISFLGKGFYMVKLKINGVEIIKKLVVI